MRLLPHLHANRIAEHYELSDSITPLTFPTTSDGFSALHPSVYGDHAVLPSSPFSKSRSLRCRLSQDHQAQDRHQSLELVYTSRKRRSSHMDITLALTWTACTDDFSTYPIFAPVEYPLFIPYNLTFIPSLFLTRVFPQLWSLVPN